MIKINNNNSVELMFISVLNQQLVDLQTQIRNDSEYERNTKKNA